MRMIRCLLLLLTLGLSVILRVHAQGTSFSYQGRLTDGATIANGTYDFRFALYPSIGGGSPKYAYATNLGVPVTNGLFTAQIDFGNVFNGSINWMEISVRTNGSPLAFSVLSPRQNLQTVPSAVYALTASNVLGTVSVSNLPSNVALLNGNANFSGTVSAGIFYGNGAGLTNINLPGAGTLPASPTNQGAVTSTGYAALNNLPGVQLTATPFKTPPMGWMSWNCCGNDGARESNCYNMATNLMTNGLLALGYNLIAIDGGWQGYRDTNGFIHESNARFPHGMATLVSTLHSMGFKVGIYGFIDLTNSYNQFYSDNDSLLINTNFSTEQELINDAQTYVNWGIDYMKLEGSTNQFVSEEQEQRWYEVFTAAAQNAGKPLYVMAAVGFECSPWMYGVINARRCGCYDMGSYIGNEQATFGLFLNNFWHAAAHPEYSSPGCFVSMDAIPSYDPLNGTYMLMFAMMHAEIIWSYVGPLGSHYSDAAYNTNLIQIDQDPAAIMARCILTNGAVTVWKKPLGSASSPTFALAFLNSTFGGSNVTTSIPFTSLGITSAEMTSLDLISNTTTIVSNTITVSVPPATAYGFKLSPRVAATIVTTGTNYTLGAADRTVLVSASSQTITLPAAGPNIGQIYTIKLTVSGTVTISTTNSQKIDGATSYVISSQYKYVSVQSDGSQWWVVASN